MVNTIKKGIPKKRLPEGLEGIIRSGKITKVHNSFFVVETKRQGIYFFKKEDAKIFKEPIENSKVYICFYGHEKETYYPFKVCDLENKNIFYKE